MRRIMIVAVAVVGLAVMAGGARRLADGSLARQRTPERSVAVDTERVYDPVAAGERLPSGFRQLLPRDAIRPVYEPVFIAADDAGWSENTLVIGVDVDGDARAYPVAFLNRREMVVDRVAGIPVLVTW